MSRDIEHINVDTEEHIRACTTCGGDIVRGDLFWNVCKDVALCEMCVRRADEIINGA